MPRLLVSTTFTLSNLANVLDDLVTSILVLLSVTIYRPCVFQCEDEERALVATLRSTTALALPRCVFILSVHRTRGANPS